MLSVRVAARNALGLSDWSEPACIDCGSTSDMAHIDVATIDLGPAIGEGGFSVVHRGTYRGTLVAIKAPKDFRAEIGAPFAAKVPVGICHLFDQKSGARL